MAKPQDHMDTLREALMAEQARLPPGALGDVDTVAKHLLWGLKSEGAATTPEVSSALESMEFAHPDSEPGMDEDMHAEINKDYLGRPWRPEQREALGREPLPRELSPGSEQLRDIDRRKTLTDSLLRAHNPGPAPPIYTDPYEWGRRFWPEESVKNAKVDEAMQQYKDSEGKKFGESGWLGAIDNPEYAFGHLNTQYLQPFSEAASRMASDSESILNAKDPNFAVDDPKGPSWSNLPRRLAEIPSRLAIAGGEYAGKYLPEAFGQATAARIFNKISPQLNVLDGASGLDRDKIVKEGRQNYEDFHGLTADDQYRKWTGQHPSWMGGRAMSAFNGALDPSTLLLAGAKTLPKFIANAGREVLEETPLPVALPLWAAHQQEHYRNQDMSQNGGKTNIPAQPEYEDPNWTGNGPEGRTWGNLPRRVAEAPVKMLLSGLTSGNKERTDLYKPDKATGELAPESDSDFNSRMNKEEHTQREAPAKLHEAVRQHGDQYENQNLLYKLSDFMSPNRNDRARKVFDQANKP
jgi:hypothetical protein